MLLLLTEKKRVPDRSGVVKRQHDYTLHEDVSRKDLGFSRDPGGRGGKMVCPDRRSRPKTEVKVPIRRFLERIPRKSRLLGSFMGKQKTSYVLR